MNVSWLGQVTMDSKVVRVGTSDYLNGDSIVMRSVDEVTFDRRRNVV